MVLLMISQVSKLRGAVQASRLPVRLGVANGLLRLERHGVDHRFISSLFPARKEVNRSVDLNLDPDPATIVACANSSPEGVETTEEVAGQGGDSTSMTTTDPRLEGQPAAIAVVSQDAPNRQAPQVSLPRNEASVPVRPDSQGSVSLPLRPRPRLRTPQTERQPRAPQSTVPECSDASLRRTIPITDSHRAANAPTEICSPQVDNATPIRTNLNDGLVLTPEEYTALQIKRAGKTVVRGERTPSPECKAPHCTPGPTKLAQVDLEMEAEKPSAMDLLRRSGRESGSGNGNGSSSGNDSEMPIPSRDPRSQTAPVVPVMKPTARTVQAQRPTFTAITTLPPPTTTIAETRPTSFSASRLTSAPASASAPASDPTSRSMIPSLSITRPLGRTPSAAPGERPLPAVVQVDTNITHRRHGEGRDAAGQEAWSFARLRS
ncbi:hypothetical protein CLCR_05872 [Cladophialophora carrionii]|uniref:Uncharacterized protein n=1 Tax=Cladophialophora carrionii TaxID=86049 RepID=A0A1C1C834_9EURO|nr:hypothetical protein CLCR_05872 [Cladophialophora carrionii]